MHGKFFLFTLLVSLSLTLCHAPKLLADDGNGEPCLELPIRFHLLSDITMEKAGVQMGMWVTAEDVTDHIVPEMNRIWEPAGIRWVVESVVSEESVDIPNKRTVIENIQESDRTTTTFVSEIESLFPLETRHPAILNVNLFPFLGETRQGFAFLGGGWESGIPNDGGNRAYVGVWTDKPSRGVDPPQQFPLTEALPFDIGSIARTCSHEVGHNLRLGHPDTSTQVVFNRLMGGIQHGYVLIEDEIDSSRAVAMNRLDAIARWDALFPSALLGDVNLDVSVNFLDVSPFVERLMTGTYQTEADIDGDEFVNFADIGPFIDLLSSVEP